MIHLVENASSNGFLIFPSFFKHSKWREDNIFELRSNLISLYII